MNTEPEHIIQEDGAECWADTLRWYLNGKLHRTDSPAVIYRNGDQFWFQNGVLHREDGAAVIWADGTEWWYLNGKKYEYKDWLTARGSDATINT